MRTYGRSWSLWMAWLVVMCLTEHALAADSLSVGIVTVTGLDYSSYLADQTSGVVAEMENDAALKQLLAFPYSSTSTTVSEDNATSDIEEWVRTTPVSFIEGGIPFNMTNFSSTLVVDPINATTGLHMQSTNIIYLFPTLVQQLYVCAFYCSEHDISTTHLRFLLRDDSDGVDAITAAAKVAFSFYGLSLPSSSVVVSGATISDELLTSGTTFVVGLTTADVAPLVTFLEDHSDATVIVDFDDLTVLYDTFVTSFGTEYKSAMSRLLYTTNLPRWSEAGVPTDVLMELHARAYAEDESAPFETPTMALTGATAHYSDAMSIFYANMPATYRTPAGLRAFVTALVAGLTSLEAKKLTSAGISKAFFSTKTVEIDDMIFGPYTTGCTGPSQNPSSCIVNYGATKLWLWPYSSIYDKDVSPATSRALTPPLGDGSGGFQAHNYGTGARGTFTDNYVLWIILAIIALMLLLLLILLIMCCCCPCACCPCGRSSSSTQEKEADEQDMTIVVVSVADRGWLWYHEPESMKGAVDELQRLVQRVAHGERCHLSRSSGETFVVRSKTAEDALRFGQRIQTEVRSHHSHDVSAICHAAQEEGADEPLQGRACYAAGYLPVRVGMHSGHCERTPDAEEVQETDLEPCAAATSGLGRGGGQVLMTEATHRMLPSSADKNYHIEFFGEHAVGNNDTPQRIFILKEDKPEREVAQERSTAVRQVEEERVREARGEAHRVMDAPRVVESTEPQERFAEGQASRALPIANTGVEEEEEEDDEWQEAEGQTSRVMYSDPVQQEEEEEVVLEERAVCASPEDEKEEEEVLADRLSAYTEEPPRSVYEDDAPIKLPPPVITCSVGTQVEDNWHRSPREEEGEQSYSPMEGCLVPIPAPILAPRPERCERSAYTYPDKSHVDSIYPSTDNRSSYDRRWNQEASTMYRSSYYDGPHRPEESWSRDLPERRPRSPLPPPSPSKPPQLRGWDAYHVEEWE